MTALLNQILLLVAFSISEVHVKTVTEYPVDIRTGKLHQFVGFVTPRPPPSNGPFVFGSTWASWSAWSYCVNNVRVRVRACNTIRGFSCLGHNQEFMECESDHPQHIVRDTEYEAVDPWEDDRREAMRQLFSSNYAPADLKARNLPNTGMRFGQGAFHPQQQPGLFPPAPIPNYLPPMLGNLDALVQTDQRNAIIPRHYYLHPEKQSLLPESNDPAALQNGAIQKFPPLPMSVENSDVLKPSVMSAAVSSSFNSITPVPMNTNPENQFQGLNPLPLTGQSPGMPLIRPPSLSPSNGMAQMASIQPPQQMPVVAQLPQTTNMPPEIPQLSTQYQSAPPQVTVVASNTESLQETLSVPTSQQMIQTHMPPVEISGTRPPVSVMVQMPSNTFAVSQQTGNLSYTTESSLITYETHPVVTMVNSAQPESPVSAQPESPISAQLKSPVSAQPESPVPQSTGTPSLPSLSSSQTSWPSKLSMVSSSLASLPQITSLLSPVPTLTTQPLSLSPLLTSPQLSPLTSSTAQGASTTPTTTFVFTTTTTTSADQNPTNDQPPLLTARTLNMEDATELPSANNEIVHEQSKLEFPQSNITVKKLHTVRSGIEPAVVASEKQDRGISRRKPTTFLGEVQGELFERLPKQTSEQSSQNNDVLAKDILAEESKILKQPLSNEANRRISTLHSGEINFDSVSSKHTNDESNLFNKKISDNTAFARPILMNQDSSDFETVPNHSGLQSGEVLLDEENYKQLQHIKLHEGATNEVIKAKAFAQKNRIVESKIDLQSFKNLRRTTTRPLTAFEFDAARSEKEVDKMKKEIEKLKDTMEAMKDIIGSSSKEKAYQKAVNLNLVPIGPSTPASPTTTPVVIDQSRLILLSINEKTPADWSEWTEWQRCFCGKQIRTRICQYDDPYLTMGCVGKSYESRPCHELENCPTTAMPQLMTKTSLEFTESPRKKQQIYKPLSVAFSKPSKMKVVLSGDNGNGESPNNDSDNDNDSTLTNGDNKLPQSSS